MYTHAQLALALRTLQTHPDPAVRAAADARVRRWLAVIEGMADGSLSIGSRAPVDGVPVWATLEVVTGGFATGRLLAERDGAGEANLRALGEGRAELLERLARGAYRIDVPEQGALPVALWLIERGHVDAGLDLIEALRPWLDRLAFTPDPAPPSVASPAAFVRTVEQVADALAAKRPQPQVAAMNETLGVWRPLQDELAALLHRTAVDGRVGERVPAGWWDDARALAGRARALLAAHPRARRPRDARAPLGRMLAVLLDAVDRGDAEALQRASGALASHSRARGIPGSDASIARASAEREHAARPLHHALAHALAARLRRCPPGRGLPDPAPWLGPIEPGEAAPGAPAGAVLPDSTRRVVDRCVEGTLDELVARGRIGSAEVLAAVSPLLTSSVRALAIGDPVLRALRARIDLAFRRRRGLLLVDLQHQVRLRELPWIAAMQPLATGVSAAEGARATLESLALLAFDGFPETQLPNPLVSELRTLAEAAGVKVALTEELAADIFMGTFTPKFVQAARVACGALEGTLYARYFDLPSELPALDAGQRGQEGYAALCRARVPPVPPRPVTPEEVVSYAGFAREYRKRHAGWLNALDAHVDRRVPGLPEPGGPPVPGVPELDATTVLDVRRIHFMRDRSVALNGAILEQSLILTTHGVVPLIEALGLRDRLVPLLPSMGHRAFAAVARQVADALRLSGVPQLRALKNAAYGWRQLVLWLSLDPAGPDAFLASAHPAAAGPAFAPVWEGLVRVAAGERFDADGRIGAARRFTGWSPGGPHWLVAR